MDSTGNFETSKTFKQPFPINFHEAFNKLQVNCYGLFSHLTHLNPQTHLHSTLSSLQTHARNAFEANFSGFNSSSSSKAPLWARIPHNDKTRFDSRRKPAAAMSNEDIEERLAGVPVYALSNPDEEFVLVSGVSTKKSLGLLCFNKEDAEALLEQMKSMDPGMRRGSSKVVAVALNKVFQLKVDGVAFRLIPEPTQIKNAIRVREQGGLSDDGFPGVPVFQEGVMCSLFDKYGNRRHFKSRSLVLRSENKSYRPVFFRKEDLEKSLYRASRQQKQLNPAFRQGDIQVAVFEEIIKGMKDSTTTKWDDVVFIPPGFDVSTDPTMINE